VAVSTTSHRLVVAALREEVAVLLGTGRSRRLAADPPSRLWQLDSDRGSCRILVTGEGRRSAGQGLEAALAAWPSSSVLVLGVSGGLRADLEQGRMVVGTGVQLESGDRLEVNEPSSHLPADACRGDLLTVDRIVARPSEKKDLLRSSPLALAVDMESWEYVRVARAHDLDVSVVRVISDAADEGLPELIAAARRTDGRIDRGRIVLGLLRRPGQLPRLLELRRRVRRAATVLAMVAGPPGGRKPGDGEAVRLT
jgi:adenosylhomocysteine nucleosidase